MVFVSDISFAYAQPTTTTAHACCSKDHHSETEKDHCLKNKAQKENNPHNDSKNTCKHSSCCCSAYSFFYLLSLPESPKGSRTVIELNDQVFGFIQTNYSSDFSSIWLPPKIA